MDCKTGRRVDLHVHSTASDGTLAPHELLHLAKESGLAALSITDHDTVAGVREAINAGIPAGLEFISGIEISTAFPEYFPNTGGSFHILGYGIRIEDEALNRELEILQQARKNRNPEMIRRLNALGIDLTLEEVETFSKDGPVSRPHIAQALKARGIVKTIDDAFQRYIGNNGPAYADKYRIPCENAVDLIRKAGGIPVVAHPGLLKHWGDDAFTTLVSRLKEAGLAGIEVFYPRHSAEQIRWFTQTAREYDLLLTGGTDFHGSVTPGLQLGSGKGDFCVPYSVYRSLAEHQTQLP